MSSFKNFSPTFVFLVLFLSLFFASPSLGEEPRLIGTAGVNVGPIPCLATTPFGAYWENDNNNRHQFQTERTECSSNTFTLRFLAFAGNAASNPEICPRSNVPVAISYQAPGTEGWVFLRTLAPDDFRTTTSVSATIGPLDRATRIRFRFESAARDPGVWSIWRINVDCVFTPSPSSTRTPSRTPSSTRTPSRTPSSSRTPSRTPSSSRTLSRTSSVTPSISISPPRSRTPSVSLSRTPSISLTPSITPTSSVSLSRTPSNTPTRSKTPSRSRSASRTPRGDDDDGDDDWERDD